ncbi:MAG: ABC transporter substrate-binding protein [Pseudomonadota bacterium]|nr:ABC transporter substrate-binding protein [Pseudomonadota bacterium]
MNAITRRTVLGGASSLLATPAIVRAQGGGPIRIGEISSYASAPEFTKPYRKGWQMAVEEINARGGVLGRKVTVISRDDEGRTENAVRVAGELVAGQRVDLLAGGFLSDVGLAISDYALRANKLYVAGQPLTDELVWQHGNRVCFRLSPSTYMQTAMLISAAAALPARRWATVAPDYLYGRSAVKWFKQLLTQRRPDVQFVAEQWAPLRQLDAGATVTALERERPDAIFNVTYATDLVRFAREGNVRGLFRNRSVVSLLTGEPDYLNLLGADTPVGWIVTGYPGARDESPANSAFANDYEALYQEAPEYGSVIGYSLLHSIAAGILRSGGTGTDQMVRGFAGAEFETPFGPVTYRPLDHQSTMGTFVGKLAIQDGRGILVDWRYVDGATVMPPDTEIRKMRPAG